MRTRALFLIVSILLSTCSAFGAQDVGIYSRSGTSSIANPTPAKTWLADYLTGNLFFFNGSSVWEQRTPPKFNLAGTVPPSISNDSSQGYAPGSVWFDTVGKQEYLCSDATAGAAVWSQISNLVGTITLPNKLTVADWLGDFVASGLLGSVPSSSLTMTTPAGVVYFNSQRMTPGASTFTYLANQDTYDYLQSNGTINHINVPNNDPAPTGQPGLFIQKVVTGSVITSVTQTNATAPAAFVRATKVNLLSNNANFLNVIAPNGVSGNWTYTVPDLGGNASFILGSAGSGSAGLPFVATGSNLPGGFSVLGPIGGGTGLSALPASGQMLIGNGTGYTLSTIAPGSSKVSITPGVGSLAIDVVQSNLQIATSQVTGTLPAANGGTGSGTNPTSGQIGIGNGSNVYAPTTVSGDVTINSSGVTAIGANKVTNSQLATVANNTVKGNVSGSSANPSDLTATQLTTLVNLFTSSLSGAAPASGGGTTNFLRADGSWAVPALAANIPIQSICNGRLTLTTATPVTTSDVTAATTLYFSPFAGNQIGLYDGSSVWNLRAFSELSVSLSGLTANTNYDVFIYDNAGTATIDTLTAWTNDTTRATALVLQNGVLVKSGATTRRYIGTIRITGTTGQTEDSAARRYVWNYYNRVQKLLRATDSTATWTYNSTTYRPFNNSTTDGTGQFSYVQGFSEEPVTASATALFGGGSGTLQQGFVGIGVDSTSTSSATILAPNVIAVTNGTAQTRTSRAEYFGFPGIGKHTFSALERTVDTNSLTFCGNNGAGTSYQSGMVGFIRG